jgi:large subunit ribosomal protein L4
MAAPKAAVLSAPGAATKGGAAKDQSLDSDIFGGEIKPHLVHEAVRAEQNAQRAGTSASKSRGLVSGGRSKPWRQKGTGRARAGTTRAAQFTGGGHVFAKVPRRFDLKVNRKAAKAALRSALASHAQAGSVALVDATTFDAPSTKLGRSVLDASGLATPILVVLTDEEVAARKSFRNLPRVVVVAPSELEVGAVVWARSLVVSQGALPTVETRAR